MLELLHVRTSPSYALSCYSLNQDLVGGVFTLIGKVEQIEPMSEVGGHAECALCRKAALLHDGALQPYYLHTHLRGVDVLHADAYFAARLDDARQETQVVVESFAVAAVFALALLS